VPGASGARTRPPPGSAPGPAGSESNSKLKMMKDMSQMALSAGMSGQDDNESSMLKLLRTMIKCLVYPIIFIFLIIFPYIYVTYASFKKIIQSYRKNVITM